MYTYSVKYVDGDKELCVPEPFIRAVIMPSTEVEVQYGDEWFPGTVEAYHYDGHYRVSFDDGEIEDRVPRELIRAVDRCISGSIPGEEARDRNIDGGVLKGPGLPVRPAAAASSVSPTVRLAAQELRAIEQDASAPFEPLPGDQYDIDLDISDGLGLCPSRCCRSLFVDWTPPRFTATIWLFIPAYCSAIP